MKKIVVVLFVLMLALPASAQPFLSDDFESGDYSEQWKVWNGNQNVIVGAENAYNESQYAYEIKYGTFINLRGLKANSTYRVVFFIKNISAKNNPKFALQRYDPDQKKLVDVMSEFISLKPNYERVVYRFTTKKSATTHRITLVPAVGGGSFVIDDFKVVQIPQYQ